MECIVNECIVNNLTRYVIFKYIQQQTYQLTTYDVQLMTYDALHTIYRIPSTLLYVQYSSYVFLGTLF